MTRIYIDDPLTPASRIMLRGTAFAHAFRVLRLRVGDTLLLFNGDGRECTARVDEVTRNEASCTLIDVQQPQRESPLRISLLQAVGKGERMDWALQKATELGVSDIQPVTSARCNVKMDAQRWQKKRTHWQAVVASACEQSGRVCVPRVAEVLPLGDALTACDAALRLMLHPEGGALDDGTAPADIALLVGPEGGFSDDEAGAAEGRGFRRWCLGPRVLRTETAPAAALAVLQYCYGDLRS